MIKWKGIEEDYELEPKMASQCSLKILKNKELAFEADRLRAVSFRMEKIGLVRCAQRKELVFCEYYGKYCLRTNATKLWTISVSDQGRKGS